MGVFEQVVDSFFLTNTSFRHRYHVTNTSRRILAILHVLNMALAVGYFLTFTDQPRSVITSGLQRMGEGTLSPYYSALVPAIVHANPPLIYVVVAAHVNDSTTPSTRRDHRLRITFQGVPEEQPSSREDPLEYALVVAKLCAACEETVPDGGTCEFGTFMHVRESLVFVYGYCNAELTILDLETAAYFPVTADDPVVLSRFFEGIHATGACVGGAAPYDMIDMFVRIRNDKDDIFVLSSKAQTSKLSRYQYEDLEPIPTPECVSFGHWSDSEHMALEGVKTTTRTNSLPQKLMMASSLYVTGMSLIILLNKLYITGYYEQRRESEHVQLGNPLTYDPLSGE